MRKGRGMEALALPILNSLGVYGLAASTRVWCQPVEEGVEEEL
jgi:hypothetical protein